MNTAESILRGALMTARQHIVTVRDSIHQCHMNPLTGEIDPEGRESLDAYALVIAEMDRALGYDVAIEAPHLELAQWHR